MRARLLAALCVGFLARSASAQTSPISVVAVDSEGHPVDAAEVSVLRDQRVVANARTADDGSATLILSVGAGEGEGDYNVVVRKVGFKRFDRFVSIAAGKKVELRLTMVRIPTVLPTVRVDANEDERHKRLFIDADAIEASPRPILDALDVVGKLRLDMRNGLGDCPMVEEIWVNGRRVTPLIYTPNSSRRRAEEMYDQRTTIRIQGTVLRKMPVSVASVLASIHPEHIAEMSYHDCTDKPMDKPGTTNAIFVVLKYGVGFSLSQGSYVTSDSSR